MTIEITNVIYYKETKVLVIDGIDAEKCRDLNTVARARDIEIHRQLVYDTKEPAQYSYIDKWLHRQKITAGCQTYGEALKAVIGTITIIKPWYS